MIFLILSDAQANAVRGPTAPGFALEPMPLVGGEHVLPVICATAPEHAQHAALLQALPQREVQAAEWPSGDN